MSSIVVHLLGKFASESLKSENLHMYRVYTHHVGEAVPKSGPVFPIVVGEVKGLPDNFVNFVVGLDVPEIENVRVFVCVHGVLLGLRRSDMRFAPATREAHITRLRRISLRSNITRRRRIELKKPLTKVNGFFFGAPGGIQAETARGSALAFFVSPPKCGRRFRCAKPQKTPAVRCILLSDGSNPCVAKRKTTRLGGFSLARLAGFEPATYRFVAGHSIH